MSEEKNRYDYITFGWIGTIVGLLLLAALIDAHKPSSYQSRFYSNHCAHQFPDSPFGEAYGRNSYSPDPPGTTQPDWCGLSAQQSVAEDTTSMYRLAIASLLLTLIGIFFVWRTLLANRQATNAALAAANAATQANLDAQAQFAAEQRPWLALDRPEISASFYDGEFSVLINVEAENIGRTPAIHAELFTQIYISTERDGDVSKLRIFAEANATATEGENSHKLIFPDKKRKFYDYLREDGEVANGVVLHTVRVIYGVRYSGGGTETYFTVGEAIFSAHKAGPGNKLTGELTSVSPYIYYGVGYAT